MFFVYILESQKNGKFYIGQTNNLELRIKRHNMGRVLSTKSGVPWQLIFQNEYQTRKEAINIERKLKGLKKRDLIIEFASKNKFRGIAQSGPDFAQSVRNGLATKSRILENLKHPRC